MNFPERLGTGAIDRFVIATLGRDSREDTVICGRKRHCPRPVLCRSDGDIGVYWRRCEQNPDSNS